MLARHNRTLTVVKLRSDNPISGILNAYQEYVNARLTAGLRSLSYAVESDPETTYNGKMFDDVIKVGQRERPGPTTYDSRRSVVLGALSELEADGRFEVDTTTRRNMLADEVCRLWSIGERSARPANAPARFNAYAINLLSPGRLRVLMPCRRHVLTIHPVDGMTMHRLSGWLCRDQAGHYLQLTGNAFAEPIEIPEELPNSLWSGPNDLWFQNLPPRIQTRLNRLYTDYLRHSMDATNHHDIDAKRAQRQRAKCQVIESEIRSITSEFNCPTPYTLGE